MRSNNCILLNDIAIEVVPCIMVLKEIHVLTKQDSSVSSGTHEPRLDVAFEQHVANLNEQLMTSYVNVNLIG